MILTKRANRHLSDWMAAQELINSNSSEIRKLTSSQIKFLVEGSTDTAKASIENWTKQNKWNHEVHDQIKLQNKAIGEIIAHLEGIKHEGISSNLSDHFN